MAIGRSNLKEIQDTWHSFYIVTILFFRSGRLITPTRRNSEGGRWVGVAFSRSYEVLNPNRGCPFVSPYLGFGFTTMAFFMIAVDGGRGAFSNRFWQRSLLGASFASTGLRWKRSGVNRADWFRVAFDE